MKECSDFLFFLILIEIAKSALLLRLPEVSMFRLEQLFLNNNNLNHISYPDCGKLDKPSNECGNGSEERSSIPFKSLCSLYLGTIIKFYNAYSLSLVPFSFRRVLFLTVFRGQQH